MKTAFLLFLSAVAFAQCPSGQYKEGEACVDCPLGYYCVDEVKRACVGGAYADETGLSACKACENTEVDGVTTYMGAYASTGYANDKCTVCEAGYLCFKGRAFPCDAFSYAYENSGSCTVCEPGSYLVEGHSSNGRLVNVDCKTCEPGFACPDIFHRYECGGQSYSPEAGTAGDCRPCFGTVAEDHNSCEKAICGENEVYILGECVSKDNTCEELGEGWTYDHVERIFGTTAYHACTDAEEDHIAGYTTKRCTSEGWVDDFNYCAGPVLGSMGVDVSYVFHNVYYNDILDRKDDILNAFLYAMPAWLGDVAITKIEDKSNYEENTMATLLEVRLYALVHKHSEVVKNIQYLGHANHIISKLSYYLPTVFHPGMVVDIDLHNPIDFRDQCPSETEHWEDTFQWSQFVFEDRAEGKYCPAGKKGTLVRNCISKGLSAQWGPTESYACWDENYEEHDNYGMIFGTIKLEKLYYNYVGTNATRFIIPAMIRAQPTQIYDLQISALWSEKITENVPESTTHGFIPVTAFNFRYVVPAANRDDLVKALQGTYEDETSFISKFYNELMEVDNKRFFSQVRPSIQLKEFAEI